MKRIYIPLILSGFIFFTFPGIGDAGEKKQEKGILMKWEEANQTLPRYSKFTVIDMNTGKKFRVQRRAGSRHADVQPLSAKDTKIMKGIYDGKWSWKRRAIFIPYKGKRIAASMHGMPHGAGALQNNFPGHFCIHFYGSTTHRSNFMDLSHQLMILKAAGKLKSHIAKQGPYEVISAFIAGIKQHDSDIVSLTSLQDLKWNSVFDEIENIRISGMPLLPEEDIKEQIILTVPITLDMQLRGKGAEKFQGEINVVRLVPYDSWKVDSSFLKEEILK
ncbi:hypothetical protein [Neobacillus terrae]|uniref:hypothetical protein n=1 Tax=Neobacillus terrae TaxID=3034837 RepID=UPI00140E05D8|nr:hypothetical protein [Neobacillus terrae]NHM29337.1 hypothetical protein [Neobacillus terrae]